MEHGVKRIKMTQDAKKAKLLKDKTRIEHYKTLVDNAIHSKERNSFDESNLAQTSIVLDLNPEFYTIWNYRRDILSHLFDKKNLDKKSALEEDLKMIVVFFKRFPKSYWIWNHRKWCLNELSKDGNANWDVELSLVSKMLQIDQRNFHGWQYRRYVISKLESEYFKADTSGKIIESNLKELQYTTGKINNNISNFSAWHNRTKLISKLSQLVKDANSNIKASSNVNIYEDPIKLLNRELELVKTGMFMDVEDTSVWLYLQWLLVDPLFVDSLKASYKGMYIMLEEQLKIVHELNELEKEDHPLHLDNIWCLKSATFIRSLMINEKFSQKLANEINSDLKKLIELDSLRRGKYFDQLYGKSPISMA